MYAVSVLAVCLLAATTFAGDTAIYNGTDTTPQSNTSGDDYEDNDSLGTCWPECEPGLGGDLVCYNGTCHSCYECCANRKEDCPRKKCYCNWFLTDKELKIVAQAVLGVAVFVTCVALLSLLWKLCARRLRRRRAAAMGVGADLLDDTTSLSSQQVFIVERLRDRPPRYEDATNDFAVEKPPPYSEVAVDVDVETAQRSAQTVSVGGATVTLVASGLTARNFAAPPPYSPGPDSLLPSTPPVQRLRRCVRKVVVIGRLGRRSAATPETDGSNRPKWSSHRRRGPPRAPAVAGLSSAAAPPVTAPGEVATSGPRPAVAAEGEGTADSSPTSTVA